ncbi:MAG: tRNA (adenosine(37)-N6)-dimethylallyltransferase MiaA [bacterium]|jgi:tRNA dimethylallyltransferase
MSKNLKPLIVIVGETASGKTEMSLNLAKIFKGEIISCDSRTIYKGMKVGTAAPSEGELDQVEHHLLNCIDPNSPISAADFKTMCKNEIDKINAKDKLPFMVGGSGLYVDSVIYDYDFSRKQDNQLREDLKKLNVRQLKEMVIKKGLTLPKNENNSRHLISVVYNNGNAVNDKIIDNCLVIGLSVDKNELQTRVENRISKMLDNGLEDEVRYLSEIYGWDIEPMKSIGYREFRDYFEGKINHTELRKILIKDTLNYAKRQRTWFKRNKNIHWIDKQSEAVDLITTFLNK